MTDSEAIRKEVSAALMKLEKDFSIQRVNDAMLAISKFNTFDEEESHQSADYLMSVILEHEGYKNVADWFSTLDRWYA